MFQRFLFFSFIVPYFFFTASADESLHFDLAISLGNRCQPAIHLSANEMRSKAFPFDWLITPFSSLCHFLRSEGSFFLLPQNLLFNVIVTDSSRGVVDQLYQIIVVHEFDYEFKGSDYSSLGFEAAGVRNYELIKERYNRRIGRFFEVCRSDAKILFIRLGITKEEAFELTCLIEELFPQLNFMLLALDHTEDIKQPWNLSRVINLYLSFDNYWHGNPQEWTALLSLFHINDRLTYAEQDRFVIEENYPNPSTL